MPRPKQRTGALREHVVLVAVALLESEGPAALTTRRVAGAAATSTPAVYELFGDKAGLVRAICFHGFRDLQRRLEHDGEPADPRAGVVALVDGFRRFARDHPALTRVMFARRVAEHGPDPEELAVAAALRGHIVGRVRRCTDAGLLRGDPVDAAHVLLALAQGLAAQETAGWLGTTAASRDRRWRLAVEAALDGLRP